ncbi:MAG TPA: Flp pilus assembly protein CpaB [Acidithiobacillus sp.]|nr:Flp pilus assembly protein CpaB [Acidithiobacillus sp.]
MSTPIKPESTPPMLQKKSRALTGWILLAVAILAGLGAAFLAVQSLDAQESALKQRLLRELTSKKESTIPVVVPIENLPAKTVLTLSMVARRNIPADSAPGGVVMDTDFNKIEYKRLLFPAERGKPLTLSMFSSTESPADILDSHHIALTISVNSENSMDKMLRPGDRVDMLWITQGDVRTNAAASSITNLQMTPAAPEGALVRFLGQNLKVIATGKDLSPNGGNSSAEGYNTITLEVTPLQAQKILVAQKSGEIRLDLRGNDKNGAWPKRTVSLHDIIGYPHAAAGVEYIAGGYSGTSGPSIANVQTAGTSQPSARATDSSVPGGNGNALSDNAPASQMKYLPFSYVPPLPQP